MPNLSVKPRQIGQMYATRSNGALHFLFFHVQRQVLAATRAEDNGVSLKSDLFLWRFKIPRKIENYTKYFPYKTVPVHVWVSLTKHRTYWRVCCNTDYIVRTIVYVHKCRRGISRGKLYLQGLRAGSAGGALNKIIFSQALFDTLRKAMSKKKKGFQLMKFIRYLARKAPIWQMLQLTYPLGPARGPRRLPLPCAKRVWKLQNGYRILTNGLTRNTSSGRYLKKKPMFDSKASLSRVCMSTRYKRT